MLADELLSRVDEIVDPDYVIATLTKAVDFEMSLHVMKGRGYQPALDKPGKFHGLGPYKVEDGSTNSTATPTCSATRWARPRVSVQIEAARP